MKLRMATLNRWLAAFAIAVLAPLANANLVGNPGFESVNLFTPDPPWVVPNPPVNNQLVVLGATVHSGSYSAVFSYAPPNDVDRTSSESQSLTLAPGPYNVGFYLNFVAPEAGKNPFEFTAKLGTFDLIALLTIDIPDLDGWSFFHGVVNVGVPGGPLDLVFAWTVSKNYVCSAGGGCDISLDDVSVVPEPGSVVLVGLGLIGVAAVRRRKQAA